MNSILKNTKLYIAKRRWLGILLQVLLVIMIFLAITSWQTRHATRGEAPSFSGHLINNDAVSLQNYRGKPLLLHFWATWCPVCKLEQNSITRISNDSDDSHYQVLTIASWSGTASDVAEYMRQENLSFPVLVDDDGSIAKLYGVQGVPTSFVINTNGFIQFVEQGYTTETGLRLRLWWLKNN
jgi:peroxiredoxin